jgi:hypothetical protein
LQNAFTVHRVEAPTPSSDLKDEAATTTRTGTTPAGWRKYDSTAEKFPPYLQAHFVAFSFSYPPTFTLGAKQEEIFAEVTKFGPNGTDVAERFTVTWYEADNPIGSKGNAARLDKLGKDWAKGLPQFTCSAVSTTTRKIGGVLGDGQTWEFTMPESKTTFVSAAASYLVHQLGKTAGVRIDQYATWLDPQVKSAADLGHRDDLGRILETFKFLSNETENNSQPAPDAPPAINNSADDQQALMTAAVTWLRLLDAGKYPETLATASPSFAKDLTAAAWAKNHALMKKQFGPVTARDDNAHITTRRSQSEDGKETVAFILKIQTTFAKAKGVEQIGMTKESGIWKVSDYSIETKP